MKIVIPKKNSPFRAIIKKGSGIVMLESCVEPIPVSVIYYEGNLYGAHNLESYNERIKCAAGRAYTRYPTVAMSGVLDPGQFEVVGNCYPERDYYIEFLDGADPVLNEWLEDSVKDPHEYLKSLANASYVVLRARTGPTINFQAALASLEVETVRAFEYLDIFHKD